MGSIYGAPSHVSKKEFHSILMSMSGRFSAEDMKEIKAIADAHMNEWGDQVGIDKKEIVAMKNQLSGLLNSTARGLLEEFIRRLNAAAKD